ncbi:hypothetical protein [Ohtaekwangia koreensis]|nr:hypothetical protein [Ohtaekwangia koreensis]
MKNLIVFFITLAFSINSFSQSNSTSQIELPQILPASPEPSAFVKAGVGNVNTSTGAATASIPLYTIKLKDYTFPIALTYSTQGLRADEASSRVGYGWVLDASSGVITRSVKGEPDEYAQRLASPTDFTSDTDVLYHYYKNASTSGSGFDSQPDEFQFNCNGYSGKFVLDDDYIPRVTSTSNIKIDLDITVTPGSTSGNISSILLTAPDGVKYYFGTYERTTSHNVMRYSAYKLVTKTAFFLDKIELPTGEYILFHYTPINTSVATGITQTLQVSKVNGSMMCGDCSTLNSYTTQKDAVSYATHYLNSITTSNGQLIKFTYSQRPDISGDNRLTALEVVNLKKYQFEYYDVPMSSGNNAIGRFFLTKVRDVVQDAPNTSYDYILDYDRLDQVPLPILFNQDYFGYYNASRYSYLIPSSTKSDGTIDFSFRNPNSDAAKIGTLVSIRYATGGREEFIYEGNTQSTRIEKTSSKSLELSGTGGGSSGVSEPVTYTRSDVMVSWDQTVTLSAYTDDALPFDDQTTDSHVKTLSVSVYEGETLIASRSILGYASTSTDFTLLQGHTYTIKMVIYSYTEIGYVTFIYDKSNYYIYQNKQIPGVRLRQIKYTDPFTAKTYSKFYTYASLGDLTKSSGSARGLSFYSTLATKNFCGDYAAYTTNCNSDIYTSSSTNDVYGSVGSGSLIYYTTVIESDAPDFQNGGTEYTFYSNENGEAAQVVLGESVSYFSGQYPTLSGVVYKKRIFNKDRIIVQEEQNDYETKFDMTNSTYSVYVRKKYQPWDTRPDRLESFDVMQAYYGNCWNRLKKQTNRSYFEGVALTQSTQYTYGQAINVLPETITSIDSKGTETKVSRHYPNTYTYQGEGDDDNRALPGYSALTNKHILTPVVEEVLYKGGMLTQQRKTLYKDWFANTAVIAPEVIQVKESQGDDLHDALLFKQYNSLGNPLHVQMKDDLSIVYLWDDILTQPICEVKNATVDQVAYTSFENNALGNWTILSGTTNTKTGFTGGQCFTGSLKKTISAAGIYIASLWTKQSASVNGASGVLVRSVGDWKLYQWILTNPSTITIQGTDIDEVRLTPAGSLMTTFTYKPFVGINSMTDANNNVAYYEYDSFNRLNLIRDAKGNIIKTFEYHYQEQ